MPEVDTVLRKVATERTFDTFRQLGSIQFGFQSVLDSNGRGLTPKEREQISELCRDLFELHEDIRKLAQHLRRSTDEALKQ